VSAIHAESSRLPSRPTTLARGQRPEAEERARTTRECLERASRCENSTEKQDLLERAVLLNMREARAIARRFQNRGIPLEDLEQVAYLSLVAAARRFDPAAGFDFLAFARPTIRGEIKRHFRDRGWTVRPPRRIQDTQRVVTAAVSELSQSLGRSPTTTEIADHLEVREDDVVESLAAHDCFSPTSLDRPVTTDGEETPLLNLVLTVEDGTDTADTRMLLRQAIKRLSGRDQRVLGLRFSQDLTQSEIADDIGLSQMQVSRILARILGQLRHELGHEGVHAAAV
jgi:RNA polymerase sigma-B factor